MSVITLYENTGITEFDKPRFLNNIDTWLNSLNKKSYELNNNIQINDNFIELNIYDTKNFASFDYATFVDDELTYYLLPLSTEKISSKVTKYLFKIDVFTTFYDYFKNINCYINRFFAYNEYSPTFQIEDDTEFPQPPKTKSFQDLNFNLNDVFGDYNEGWVLVHLNGKYVATSRTDNNGTFTYFHNTTKIRVDNNQPLNDLDRVIIAFPLNNRKIVNTTLSSLIKNYGENIILGYTYLDNLSNCFDFQNNLLSNVVTYSNNEFSTNIELYFTTDENNYFIRNAIAIGEINEGNAINCTFGITKNIEENKYYYSYEFYHKLGLQFNVSIYDVEKFASQNDILTVILKPRHSFNPATPTTGYYVVSGLNGDFKSSPFYSVDIDLKPTVSTDEYAEFFRQNSYNIKKSNENLNSTYELNIQKIENNKNKAWRASAVGVIGGAFSGAVGGAGVGAFLGGVGAIPGAIIGASVGALGAGARGGVSLYDTYKTAGLDSKNNELAFKAQTEQINAQIQTSKNTPKNVVGGLDTDVFTLNTALLLVTTVESYRENTVYQNLQTKGYKYNIKDNILNYLENDNKTFLSVSNITNKINLPLYTKNELEFILTNGLNFWKNENGQPLQKVVQNV